MPVRRTRAGTVEVLLVTSRETQRWVIPKGWPWPEHTDWDSAAGEAREEAGVTGTTEQVCFGTYAYDKRHSKGVTRLSVDVFLLWVEKKLNDWPEKAERKRAWFTLDKAVHAVEEPKLKAIMAKLATLTRGPQSRN